MSAHTQGVSSFGLDRFLFDFEAVADPVEAAPAPAEPASPTGDPGAAVPAGDPGAAEPVAEPAAPTFDPTVLDTPEAQERINAMLEAREQAAREAAHRAELEAQARQGQDALSQRVEEALGLLGLDPADFKAYMGQFTKPLESVAEQVQQEQAVKWVDGKLTELGREHPGLLGADVAKVADYKDDQGQPLFKPDEVAALNRDAVLFAANALQSAHGLEHNAAMSEAAKRVAARDDIVGKIAVERFKAQLQAASGAPSDITGTGATGATVPTGLEGGDELAVARRFAAERAAAGLR